MLPSEFDMFMHVKLSTPSVGRELKFSVSPRIFEHDDICKLQNVHTTNLPATTLRSNLRAIFIFIRTLRKQTRVHCNVSDYVHLI